MPVCSCLSLGVPVCPWLSLSVRGAERGRTRTRQFPSA
ncbi:hypothetical protein RLOC_00003912 [Lonchura striata]|uniref:Uncharacterized protein n=1 Tax=Lonchura striata TaxID=40157 RepID=A0A218UJI5_9PASE|nr:hypothetical protein RLOC_00003912 [Lonchura striata domestica]